MLFSAIPESSDIYLRGYSYFSSVITKDFCRSAAIAKELRRIVFSTYALLRVFLFCTQKYAPPKESNFRGAYQPSGIGEYWAEFWELLEKYPIDRRTEYTDEEFCEALETYRNQEIQDSIYSLNPIVRMFAILDR